ncbi:MAG: sulfite exporter TauE/SafE family protein [Candidatus Binatia bacterium]
MPPVGLALAILIGISLGFFGGGGSILTVPLLVYVFGLDPKEAIASSLVVVGTASASGALQHWRAGNVEIRTGLLFGSAGMTGAYLGGRAGAFVDATLLLLLFAAMMAFTSVAMWRGRRVPAGPTPETRATARLIAQGLAVGMMTGLVGAGGGFLIVPALALWAGLSMPSAIGTSLFVIVINCLAGFAGYQAHVAIDPLLVGAVTTSAIAGSFVGSSLTRLVDPASLRRAFASFVLVMSVVILFREGDIWIGTAEAALPSTLPQLVFALIMLAIGVGAGRVSQNTRPAAPRADRRFIHGEGI